jgi:hypothetical protein
MTELPGNRETAYRVFAAEFDDATVTYQESDEERAPNYVVTPTGARANRLFAVGVLTEIESVNEDVIRARVVDPTGAFVVYAGQYQPDEKAALERLEPPAFVAVTGKANTFSPDDSDRVYTSIRPESINTVDADTRDRWVVRTAEHTVERVGTLAAAADLDASGDALREALDARGLPASTASGAALALEHYGTTPAYLADVHELALDAARVVAGDLDEVDGGTRSPDNAGDGTHSYADLAGDLGDADVTTGTASTISETAAATTDADESAASDAEPAEADDADAASTADAETTSDAASTADAESTSHAETTSDETAETTDSAVNTESTADAESNVDAESNADAESADDAESTTEPESTADTEPAEDAEPADVGGGGEEDAVAADESADDEGVGDFEPGNLGGDAQAATDEMYEFDEDEREEIEAEFGTEFSSGNDVPEPEESELDAPEPEAGVDETEASSGDAEADAAAAPADSDEASGADASADDDATADDEPAGDGESAADDDGESGADDDGESESAADVDLDAFVMEAMRDLDDGDGVGRDDLVDHVVDEVGADADAVDDAVQDALMGGQCYEPDDGVLKPI